jgi:hypothetical protein
MLATMSIYLGIPSSNRQSTKEFSSIGQNYRKATSIKELGIAITRPITTFYYSAFLSLLPWIICAGFFNLPVVVNAPTPFTLSSFTVFQDVEFLFCFAMASALSAQLQQKHNLTSVRVGGKATHGYVTSGKLALSKLKAIVADLPSKDLYMDIGISGKGLSPRAAQVFMTMSRIFHGFLYSQLPLGKEFKEMVPGQNHHGYIRAKVTKAADKTKGLVLVDGEFSCGEDAMKKMGLIDGSVYDIIGVDTIEVDEIQATPSMITEADGHPIVFTPSSMPADGEFYYDLFMNHFQHAFSSVPNKAKNSIQAIKEDIPLISRFHEGQVLLFLVFCMSLAIKCGGKLQVVMEAGVVMGVVLFTQQPLILGDALRVPVEADAIRSTVSSWMTSSAALDEIAKVLSDTATKGGRAKVKIARDKINTPSRLMAEIDKRDRITEPLSISFVTALKFLTFPDKEDLPASDENITKALVNIAEKRHPSNFHIGPALFTSADTYVASNLSVFGHISISFLNPGGMQIAIYKDKDEDPNHGIKKKITIQKVVAAKKGKRKFEEKEEEIAFWDRICISRVDIPVAVQDFENFRSFKKINQLQAYDSKILGNIDVHPLKNGTGEILEALRSFGGASEDFPAKKKKVFEPAVVVDEGSDDDDEDLAGMDF